MKKIRINKEDDYCRMVALNALESLLNCGRQIGTSLTQISKNLNDINKK